MNYMRVALVHDYLNQSGGAERVLLALCELFPDAPVFTLFYDTKKTHGEFSERNIITSFLQRIPWVRNHHRMFPLLMPAGVERLDMRSYDLIISDSESFAKGIVKSPKALHISYCHTPPRFLWDSSQAYLAKSRIPSLARKLAPFGLTYLRMWDYEASKRVDHFLANSAFIGRRIKKYYKREAKVLYPPVEVKRFQSTTWKKQSYYLLLMRLVSYKRPEIVIDAFNELRLPLVVVGDGHLAPYLKRRAKPFIEFVGKVPHRNVGEYYSRAKALLFPQEEDFGISAVEAMACGTPVIAYRAGGALETIKEGVSGVFFNEQSKDGVMKAVQTFQKMEFNDTIIKESVERFDTSQFKKEFLSFVNSLTPSL